MQSKMPLIWMILILILILMKLFYQMRNLFNGHGYEESHDNVYPQYVNQMDNDHPINCSLSESTSFIQSSELSAQIDISAA